MRSKVIFGFLVSSGLFVLAGSSGCSDDVSQTSGSSSGSSSSSSSSSSSTASSSGMPMDMNVDCDSATAITLGDPALADTLAVADDDRDYFVFEGTAAQAIGIITDSKPDADEFDKTYPDLVITLKMKDANGAWVDIAQNDDPYPLPRSTNDSAMYTKLPATGTYCVEVTECNALFPGQCSPLDMILTGDYTILAGALNETAVGIQGEMSMEPVEPAGTIEYAASPMKTLYSNLSWGTYADATDVDKWAFQVPTTLVVDPMSRPSCHFEFYYPGVGGNGSTAEAKVLAYFVDAAAPTVKIAQIDPNIYDASMGPPEPMSISAPCEIGKDYLFVLERAAGATAGMNDFYFFNHYTAGANPLEIEPNSDIAMPEVLMPSANQAMGASYFVDGDIDMAGDVDIYSIEVPAMSTLLSVACESERGGSALRGFKVTPLGANDMPLAAGKGNLLEQATKQLFAYDIPIPAGVTTLKMKVEATMANAANITSNFYRCGFHVRPPAAP